MFSSLGRFTYHHRRAVLVAWALLFVIGIALAGAVMPKLTASSDPPASLESGRVHRTVSSMSHDGLSVVAVVGDADVDDPSVRAEVEHARATIAAIPGVASVVDHYVTGSPAFRADDGRASLVVVTLARGRAGTHVPHREVVADVVRALRSIDGATVQIGGSAVLDDEFAHAIEKDLAAEKKALPVAFVAMIFILGGLLAAGLPLMVAFAAVAGAMFVVYAATGVMDVSVYAINVVFMFGLGLGIDYGLLIVSRFREERAAGADIAAAVERSVATAGRTVLFSALTVAAALLGLFAFDDPTFRSFGIAGIGVVLAALAAAITLLPALLSVAGRRIKPARSRRDGRWFLAVARWVQRRAVLTVVLVGTGLAALALPFLGADFAHGDARSLPRSSEARAVAMTLTDRFPSKGADPLYAVVRGGVDHVGHFVEQVRAMDGVVTAEMWHHSSPAVPVVRIVPEGTSQGAVAQRLVHELRGGDFAVQIEVGGTAASLIDAKDDTAARLPVAFGIIALATLVLLFLMTGSIAVPIKAVLMNVLSLGASFGALVWGFQEGHLAGILGFEPVGTLDLFMPVLIFIFAFGLSMDYEVFLLARIKEIYDETGDNDEAVALGMQRTGGIVTSAAFLIVVVFAGFAMGEVLGIKMLGFGLALAVVVDATIVRMLLVPATMKLLGDWNWWAPAPLRRLHQRFGLHEAPSAAGAPELVPATAGTR